MGSSSTFTTALSTAGVSGVTGVTVTSSAVITSSSGATRVATTTPAPTTAVIPVHHLRASADKGAITNDGASSSIITLSSDVLPVMGNGTTLLTLSGTGAAGATISPANYSWVVGSSTAPTFKVTAGTTAGSLTVTFKTTPITVYQDATPTVLNVVSPGIISDNIPEQIYTTNLFPVTVSIGTEVSSGTLSLAITLSGPAAEGTIASESTLLFSGSTRSQEFVLTVTGGTTAGDLTVTYTPSGSAQYTATKTTTRTVKTIGIMTPSSGAVTNGFPANVYASSTHMVKLALSTAVATAFKARVTVDPTAVATVDPVELAFEVGAVEVNFNVTIKAVTANSPNTQISVVPVTSLGGSAYLPVFIVTNVAPRVVPVVTLPKGVIYEREKIPVMIDLPVSVPAGETITVFVMSATGATPVVFTPATTKQQFLLAASNQTLTFNVTTTGQVSKQTYSAPASMKLVVAARANATITNTPSTMFTMEVSGNITLNLAAPVKEPTSLFVELSGNSSGSMLMAQDIMLKVNQSAVQFKVQAGFQTGTMMVSYEFRGPGARQYNDPSPMKANITVSAASQVTLVDAAGALPSALTKSAAATLYFKLGTAVPTSQNLTITTTLMSLSTDGEETITTVTSTADAGATNATLSIPASTAAFMTTSFEFTGTAAAGYLPPRNPNGSPIEFAIVDAASAIAIPALPVVFAGQTTTFTVTLGSSPTAETTVVVSAPTSMPITGASSLTFAAGTTTLSQTVTVTASETPGTAVFTFSYQGTSTFSAIADLTIGIQPKAKFDVPMLKQSYGPSKMIHLTAELSVPLSAPLLEVNVAVTGSAIDNAAKTNVTAASVNPTPLFIASPETLTHFTLNTGGATGALTITFTVVSSSVNKTILNPTELVFTTNIIGSVAAEMTPAALSIGSKGNVVLTFTPPPSAALTVEVSTTAGQLATTGGAAAGTTLKVSASPFSFDIIAPGVPGFTNISFTLSGAAADLYGPVSNLDIAVTEAFVIVPAAVATVMVGGQVDLRVTAGTAPLSDLEILANVSGSANANYDAGLTSIFITGGSASQAFPIGGGSSVGDLKIDWALQGDSAMFYTIPPPLQTVVAAPVILSGVPAGLTTGQSAEVTAMVGAAVPANMTLNLRVTVSGGTAQLSSPSGSAAATTIILAFTSANSTQKFSIIAPASAGKMSVSFSSQGDAKQFFIAPAPLAFKVIAAGAATLSLPPATERWYGLECKNASILFGAAAPSDINVTLRLSDSSATVQQTNGSALPLMSGTGFTVPAGQQTGGFQICAPSVKGTLSINATIYPESFTQPPTGSAAISAKGSIALTSVPTSMFAGTTVTNLKVKLTPAIDGTSVLNLGVSLSGAGAEGASFTSPLVFSSGTSREEATFSIVAGNSAGPISINYTLSGAAAVAYNMPASQTIQVSFPPASINCSVTETTNNNGAINRYTFSFKPSQRLLKGDTLTIVGLQSPETRLDRIRQPSGGKKSLENRAEWDQTTGTLVVTVKSETLPEWNSFTVVLENAAAAQAAKNMTIRVDGSFSTNATLVTNSDKVGLAGGNTPGTFSPPGITETTNVADAVNELTLRFTPSAALMAPAVITVTGFGSSATSTGTVNVTGTSAAAVGSTAFYTQSEGTVVFTLSEDVPLPAATQAEFTFALQNPATDVTTRAAVPPEIKAKGFDKKAAPKVALKADGKKFAGVTKATVKESSNTQNAVNTITVTFTPNVKLSGGDTVQIAGAHNGNGGPELKLKTGDKVFKARFVAGTITLSLLPGQTVLANKAVSVSFDLLNPAIAMPVNAITIELHGRNPSKQKDPATVTSALCVKGILCATTPAPFKFTQVTARDTTSAIGLNNAITFEFNPSDDIPKDNNVEIAGLVSSTTAAKVEVQVLPPGLFATPASYAANTLTLTSLAVIPKNALYTVHVTLVNPVAASAGVTPTIKWKESATAAVNMKNPVDVAKDATILESKTVKVNVAGTIEESNVEGGLGVQGATNMVKVKFTPNADIAVGTLITIAGLSGYSGPVSSNTPMAGQNMLALSGDTQNFGGPNAGVWARGAGTVVLKVSKQLPKAIEQTVSFNLWNGLTKRTANVKQSIQFTDVSLVDKTDLPNADGSNTPIGRFNVGYFDTLQIQQPDINPATCPRNCPIIVDLAPSTDMAVGTKIVLSGLTGSTTPDLPKMVVNDLKKNMGDNAGIFGGTGQWAQLTGTLTLTLAKIAKAETKLRFSLENLAMPRGFQPAPAVTAVGFAADGVTTLIAHAVVPGTVLVGPKAPMLKPELVAPTPGEAVMGPNPEDQSSFSLTFHDEVTLLELDDDKAPKIKFGFIDETGKAGPTKTAALACTSKNTALSVNLDVLTVKLPAALFKELGPGTKFYVTVDNDCVRAKKTKGGLPYPGFQDHNTVFYWVAGAKVPEFKPAESIPQHMSTTVDADLTRKISLRFSQPVDLKTGFVTIFREGLAAPVAVIDVSKDAKVPGLVHLVGHLVDIILDPRVFAGGRLLQKGFKYSVTVDETCFVSKTTGLRFPGFTTGYSFTTSPLPGTPVPTAFSPALGTTDVAADTTELTITFKADVIKAAAPSPETIKVFRMGANNIGVLTDNIRCGSDAVTVVKNMVTIKVGALKVEPLGKNNGDLPNHGYYVEVPNNCFCNGPCWQSPEPTFWKFYLKTDLAPPALDVPSLVPAHMGENIKLTTDLKNPTLAFKFTFNQVVEASGKGTIGLYRDGELKPLAHWTSSAAELTFKAVKVNKDAGTEVTVSLANNLKLMSVLGEAFYIKIDGAAFISTRTGLAFAGNNQGDWIFSVETKEKAKRLSNLVTAFVRRSADGVALRAATVATISVPETTAGGEACANSHIKVAKTSLTDGTIAVRVTQTQLSSKRVSTQAGDAIEPTGLRHEFLPHDTAFSAPAQFCVSVPCESTATQFGKDLNPLKMVRTGTNSVAYVPIPVADVTYAKTGCACQYCYSFNSFSNVIIAKFTAAPTVAGAKPAPAPPINDSPTSPGVVAEGSTGSSGGVVFFSAAPAAAAPIASVLLMCFAAVMMLAL